MCYPPSQARSNVFRANRAAFYLSALALTLLFTIAPAASADYKPLYPHDFDLSKAIKPSGTDDAVIITPYTKNYDTSDVADSPTFSIYVPSGTQAISAKIGYDHGSVIVARYGDAPQKDFKDAATISASTFGWKLSELKASDMVGKVGYSDSTVVVIDDSSVSGEQGGWIYFKLFSSSGNPVAPRTYTVTYTIDPAQYSPPEGYVPPSPPPSDDGATDDGSSDGGTDPVQPTPPPSSGGTSSPNPFAGVILEPRSNILDPPDDGTENPDTQPGDNPPDAPDAGAENPDTQPVRLPARGNGEDHTPEPVHCAQVDRTNFLQPIIQVNPELLPAGTEDEVAHADAYAIFTVDESVYMVVSDILGNLTVFPFNELAFGPYGTADIKLADGTCECNAFKTVQDFLVAENIGPEELAQWEEDGTEVVFYFGIVPNGDWSYYQGTAFQIVK